jgi:acyl-CoA thioester hydrolase
MGVAYYGCYPEFFEVARTDMIRSLGITYREMEDKGIMLPVHSLTINYIAPAKYDELITIKTCLKKLPDIRISFEYEVYNENNELITTGNTILIFVKKETMKPTRAPGYFIDTLKPHFGK